ncbi:MAG: hypothetical protein LBP55_02040 [Candidatus Adiutrix sp.]|jgi:CheY-like chemotaxis protein|nr:hypothetical protein [Candidatus Adiutrix sp.]
MQLECQECHKVLNLPDNKVPIGRAFSFHCPHCKAKNTALIPANPESAPAQAEVAPPQAPDQTLFPQPGPPPAGPVEHPGPVGHPQGVHASGGPPRPRDDSEMMDDSSLSLLTGSIDDRPKALVVYDEEAVSAVLAQKLDAIGYSPSVAVNLRDAAKQLKFANFKILIIQEDYYGATLSGNHLLRSVQSLDAHTRRNMLVVLISPTMATLDDLLAFSLSFDAVVNSSELGSIERLLMSIIARAKKFYVTYNEVLAELGLD